MTIDAEPQKIGWLEYFVVMLILIFPMMRAFVPLEHYFSVIHDGNVKDALYAAPTNLTASSIENIVMFALLALLTMRHWRGMMAVARRPYPVGGCQRPMVNRSDLHLASRRPRGRSRGVCHVSGAAVLLAGHDRAADAHLCRYSGDVAGDGVRFS
jgi:hypothetical protein